MLARPASRLAILSAVLSVPVVASAAPITWDGDTNTTFSDNNNWVGGTAPANSTATDVAVFSGVPTANQPNLTGNRSINGLDFQSAGWAFSASSGTLTVGTGGIDSAGTGTNTISAPISVGVAGGTWDVGAGNTLSLTGLFSGVNAFTKDGAGKLTLSSTVANSYSGVLTVNSGTVELNGNGVAALGGGTGRGITVNNGGTVVWSSTAAGQQIAATTAQFTVATGGVVDLNGKSDSFAFSGNERITLSGGTVQTGAGTWTFTGNNTTAAIVNGSTVSTITGNVSFGGATADRAVTVSNNAAGLDFNWSANIVAGDQLSITSPTAGSGAEVSLGGNNAFTGNVTISNGVTVYLDHANAFGAAGNGGSNNSVAAGSTLALRGGINYAETGTTLINYSSTPGIRSISGHNTWNGAITNPGGSNALPAVIGVDADSLAITASLAAFSSSSRQLGKTGDGVLIYDSAANNIPGTLYVNGGSFAFLPSGEVNVRGGNTILNGGTLSSPDNITIALGTSTNQQRFGNAGGGWAAYGADMQVDVGGVSTLVWGGGTATSGASATVSSGSVTSIGISNVFLTGAGYDGSEAVTLTGGGGSGATATLIVDSSGAITGFTITNPGTGYTTAPTVAIAAPNRDGGTTNFLANNTPLLLNSTIAQHKVTLLDNLDLAASSAAFTGQREIRVLDNSASSGDRAVIDSVISSSKSGIGMNKTGAGVLELAVARTHTYDGPTNVLAGTLLVNGALNGTGAVTVAQNAVLGGSGSVAGATTVSGAVRPGNSIGTLTVTNDVTWNAGNSWQFELGTSAASLGLAASGSSTQDLLNLTGAGSDFLKGTGSSFTFDFAGTGSAGWYKLVDWAGSTTFLASDFTATNLASGLTGSFVVDNATSALYIEVAVPEPASLSLLAMGAIGLLRRKR